MVTMLRLFGFILSSLGWWEMIRKRSDVNIYFIPSLTVAVQVVFLFLSGLLNLLREGAAVLFLLGLLFLLVSAFENKRFSVSFLRNYYDPGFLYLGVISVAMGFFLKGRIFTHQDNFSHWALVVKTMLMNNRFPTFMDPLIKYQEYPLGSSAFIYYFAKIIAPSESVQMLGQVYMMLVCILPLFAFLKKNKISGFLIILSATNFFLTYNIAVTDLLVDSLLPLVGICGILFTVMCCEKEDDVLSLIFAACYAVQMVQIKNSGLFFAVPLCIWILFHRRKRSIYVWLASVAAPLFSVMLWHKHCDYVFKSAEKSRHALTLSNFKEEFFQKSAEDITAIAKDMIVYSAKWKDFWAAMALLAVLGVFIAVFAKENMDLFKKIFLISVATYVIYQVGMLGMYIFSMPLVEAVNLAGIARYNKTILMVIMYMYAVLALKTVSSLELKRAVPLVFSHVVLPASFCLLLFLSTGKVRFVLTDTGSHSDKERLWLEAAIEEYDIPKGESYCYLIPKQDYGYMRFLSKYLLMSNSNEAVLPGEEASLDETKAKYIFVYDTGNEAAKAWILENYPEQADETVIVRNEE